MPATQRQGARKAKRRGILSIVLIVASAASAADPPADLMRKAAEREAANEAARSRYLYRQEVMLEEINPRGGFYREIREVIFSPEGERTEKLVRPPEDRLQRLRMTKEDFDDMRNIQPMLLTPEMLPLYDIRARGDELLDKHDCWVLQVKPKQILDGMRLFEGLLWVEKQSLAVVRIEGQAVPPIYRRGEENLFPRFVTLRESVDGEHWFPSLTAADDTLPFKSGPLRIKLTIRYTGYKRFGAESKITFEPPQ
jgi:hypothetical protein